MRKVKLEVLKPWIATRCTELNGFEDDIVSSMIIGLLEDKDNVVSYNSSPMRSLLHIASVR
jgi:serine/arginine repetitive matrix protein 1